MKQGKLTNKNGIVQGYTRKVRIQPYTRKARIY